MNSKQYRCETPVAFIIFNRPETTKRVFDEIAKAKPKKLLVVADGPRKDKNGEKELCENTKSIIEGVNWDCEVITNYSDNNLGCKVRVSSGITWVFDQVEEAIFLEDDCLPHPSFFKYCEQLLELYRDDKRIMSISGDNFQFSRKQQDEYSFYFSRYSHIWGWASWRRAWNLYDVEMKLWSQIKKSNLLDGIFNDSAEIVYWSNVFDKVKEGEIDTWDYQWLFAHIVNTGLCVLPTNNLVSNIGFGENSTHTRSSSIFSNMEVKEVAFPLNTPPYMVRNKEADQYTDSIFYSGNLHKKILKRMFNAIR